MTTVLQVAAASRVASCSLNANTRGSLAGSSASTLQPPSRACVPVQSGLRLSFRAKSARANPTTPTRSYSTRITAEKQAEVVAGAGVVTDGTFKELVLDSDVPVLVDFWAPWCGPCRMIAPVIDEISKQYQGKLKCLKLNTDESPGVATEYGIRSIPTVMIFKKGKKLDTVIGAVPKSTLTTTIEKYLD